jgi:hypothetical protein
MIVKVGKDNFKNKNNIPIIQIPMHAFSLFLFLGGEDYSLFFDEDLRKEDVINGCLFKVGTEMQLGF